MKHVWLFLFLWPVTAEAEILYRCVEDTGAVSYQAQACPSSMRLDKTIHYESAPERAAPRVGGEASLATRRHDRSVARVKFARSASVVSSRSSPDRCRWQKLKRQNALQRLGLQRTFAQLSKLDEPVRAACGGF